MPRAVRFFFSFFSSFPFLLLFPFFVVTSYARNQSNHLDWSMRIAKKNSMRDGSYRDSRGGRRRDVFSVFFFGKRHDLSRYHTKEERRKNDDRSIRSSDAFRKPLNRHQPYPIVQPSSPFSLFPLRFESPREDRKNLERGSARVVEYLFKPRFQPRAPEEIDGSAYDHRVRAECKIKNVQR